MLNYKIPLIPGPVKIPLKIREAYLNDFGSADLEDEFFELYAENQNLIQKLLHTKNKIVITSGEAMSILWGALKSTLKPGNKLLAVSSGIFGEGFADMAESFGVNSEIVKFNYDEVPEPEKVYNAVKKFRPDVITAVHCETPSGTLTQCLEEIGNIAREFGALFIVDFVSSAGGANLNVDKYKIDIGLLGSQKVLSMTSNISVTSISPRAWEIIRRVKYSGYDAYSNWEKVPEIKFTPYTHDWHGLKALNISLNEIINVEGLENCINRHSQAAELCRDLGHEIGLKLFPKSEKICSPTVTAFYVPENLSWEKFNFELRKRGLAVGGNYGILAGKVFRIGHMGSQADKNLIREGMSIIKEVLN